MPDIVPAHAQGEEAAAQPARQGGRSRRDSLPFLHLLPNLVTVLGLCAGLTSIRFVLAGRYELAAVLIIFAALIDGLDGLLARRLKAASTFGAELDSLADFISFGVAPGLLVFQFALIGARGFGWIAVLVFAICCCLRLARFNVTRDAPPPPGRACFTGVPAPAGAMLALMPVFLGLEGLVAASAVAVPTAVYLGLVALLMVSRIPTPSLKGLRISRDKVPYVLVAAAIVVGMAFTRFWLLMILANLAYVAAVAHGLVAARRKPSL
ncbi:CDP-diacylglycerol--serine O-phosphatidyltransferase [Amaricoccus sp.]|uniref:CDP-diacylglycerol--serine O-phosphatidyltransferase n=1 Tax=Amaricoccus sp. TaxID=1872485 RepID=UPI001B5A480F|nr:CDP-diacylglycerol--serine O-phosphatidyltransferase [Amaricoccus sp.]MBP7241766.1 CDP-diacylglycerol--serine O-phosphatidyltransferase [Amaricoccus sp.]